MSHNHGTPSQEWEHGLCSCFDNMGVCCMAIWCPCILHGKTKYRLRNPTMDGYSCCNGSCMAYTVLAACLPPFYAFLSSSSRGEIRQKYSIAGGGCGDYCASLCCNCCVLIQNENEVVSRQEKAGLMGGYQAPGGMSYVQQ
ncbi:hypothetical protein RUND412_002208 [Rhizina undulata]